MKSLPAALTAHLESGATTLCHCWKLTPRTGTPLGFTDHDRDLTFDGVTFEAEAGFTASEIEQSLGFAVDNLEAGGALRSDRLSEARIEAGDFDHAAVEIWRVNWQDTSQRYLMRMGHVGEIARSGASFSAELRGRTMLLDQPRGRLFMSLCDAVVGDARCGVNLDAAAYHRSGAVLSVDGNSRLLVSGLGGCATGWFSRGLLTWTSGGNAGQTVDVRGHQATAQGQVIDLWQAGRAAIAAGDDFTVTAGCDKEFVTCREKFANGVNFRGFPHMPGDDFVLRYPVRDDPANQGGSLVS